MYLDLLLVAGSHPFKDKISLLVLFHRSVLGTEFRGELEDTVMITEVRLDTLTESDAKQLSRNLAQAFFCFRV